MNCWSPAREAFGQRGSRPEALQNVEAAQVSAASILARAVDDADAMGAARADKQVGDLGVRARVTQASARRSLDGDEIERLRSAPAPQPGGPIELEAQGPLSDVEQALRLMREQMDAALLLADTATPVLPNATVTTASAAPAAASTEAIAKLGVDLARLVEVMDCGFDRIEAANARQTLELRTEVAQMFDELASRIDKSEGQSAHPAADVAAYGSQAVPPGDVGDERPPMVDVSGDGWADAAIGEVQTRAPPAVPELPAHDVEGLPTEAQAADDPDLELFEAPLKPAGSVEPEPHAAALADPFDWLSSIAADPGAEDQRSDEVWFGPGSGQPPGETRSDWLTPSHEPATVTGLDPFDPTAADLAGVAPDSGAKSERFPWLRLRRRGESRKSA